MNIIKTARNLKVLGVKDFIISLMENQVIRSRTKHLEKHRDEILTYIVNGLTTQRKGGKTHYAKCLENILSKGEKNIRSYNLIPHEELRRILYHHEDITKIMKQISKRLNCSDDMTHYYYFEGVKPFCDMYIMSILKYGRVSWRDCRAEFYCILDSIAERSAHLTN